MSSPPRAATIVKRSAGVVRGRDLVLRRAVLIQSDALIDRQNLAKHPDDGFRREDARRQLDLPPDERAAEFVGRLGRGDDVRLFAHVHDEGVTIQTNNCVE